MTTMGNLIIWREHLLVVVTVTESGHLLRVSVRLMVCTVLASVIVLVLLLLVSVLSVTAVSVRLMVCTVLASAIASSGVAATYECPGFQCQLVASFDTSSVRPFVRSRELTSFTSTQKLKRGSSKCIYGNSVGFLV